MKLKLMLIGLLTLSSGCVTSGGDSCAGWEPIRLDAASIDGMTERDARDVLAHNEFGAARGCW